MNQAIQLHGFAKIKLTCLLTYTYTRLKACSHRSSHLTSSDGISITDLISSELSVQRLVADTAKCVVRPKSDPVRRGWDQLPHTQFRWNWVSWDDVKWGEMGWVIRTLHSGLPANVHHQRLHVSYCRRLRAFSVPPALYFHIWWQEDFTKSNIYGVTNGHTTTQAIDLPSAVRQSSAHSRNNWLQRSLDAAA